jgi:hypothetical protein
MNLVSRSAGLTLVLSVAVLTACATPGVPSPASTSTAGSSGASAPSPSGSEGGGAASGAGSAPPSGEVWLPEWAGDAHVPDIVANRRPLPFCGLEQAPAAQPMEFIDRAVRLCFFSAAQAATEAEFASVQSTMEGARFATIYRLGPDGTVEVLTDFTQDPMGGGAWVRMVCERLVEGEGESLIGVDDCGESTTLE